MALIDPTPLSNTQIHIQQELHSALLSNGLEEIEALSASGQLSLWLPEWARLCGDRNIQHKTHHYPLDTHTLWVLSGTKSSSYFPQLSLYQQTLTALGALLHDINKITGPKRLQPLLSVDNLHPIKSAEMAKTMLQRISYPPETLQRIYTLIHHHQAFGKLFVFHPQGAPATALDRIAVKLRSLGVLGCLLALSEGDIAGVQEDRGFFTPDVALKLQNYAQAVKNRIIAFREQIPNIPQTLVSTTVPQALNLKSSSGVIVQAPTWEALQLKLQKLSRGGLGCYRYYASLSQAIDSSAPYCALLRFLPENIAYTGPVVKTSQEILSMDVFYALCIQEGLSKTGLTPEQQSWIKTLRSHQSDFINTHVELKPFSSSETGFQEANFEPQAAHESPKTIFQCNEPLMVVATRPIVSGFYTSCTHAPPTLPPPWNTAQIWTSV